MSRFFVRSQALLVSGLLLVTAMLATRLPTCGEPPTLEERAAAIERASQERDGDRVVVGHISRTLSIPVSALRDQRHETGLGWGEILIANRLSRDTGLAVEQITAEHKNGKPWLDIARDHDVDTAKLTLDVEWSQNVIEQRSEDRPPRTDAANTDKSGGAGNRRDSGGGRIGRGHR